MSDLSFKEIFVLAILIIPLVLLMTGVLWGFFYTVFSFVREKFGHMHLRDRNAH
jgi:hypothetical protein